MTHPEGRISDNLINLYTLRIMLKIWFKLHEINSQNFLGGGRTWEGQSFVPLPLVTSTQSENV